MSRTHAFRTPPRTLARFLAVSLLGLTIVQLVRLLDPDPALPHPVATAPARPCASSAAALRATGALAAAKGRYLIESQGAVILADLRRIAHDSILLEALRVGNLHSALAEANRQLVRHVVQIRVLRGSRVIVDANPTSFDVAGSGVQLHAAGGRSLGRLQITVQDVIGFIKLVHKLNAADVLVRGARGHARTSTAALLRLSLPRSGCARIGVHRYVVSSFSATSFTGEPLTIWLLTAA